MASSGGSSRDEDTGIFAPVGTIGPLVACSIPESLPLRGKVAVACRDTEEEGIIIFEYLGIVEDFDCVVFGWCFPRGYFSLTALAV